ncbi:hypothetical protein MMC26_007682 [Xylographa opegraphella]|nr:hypothetical protein [Xylographa opegraphella]
MASDSTTLTTRVESGSPYQLEDTQVLKASAALLQHIKSESKRKALESNTKILLPTSDESSDESDSVESEPVWLVLTTKKHVVDNKRLKPGKILLPHSLHKSASSTICLITADPQRAFKDTIAHPSFPVTLASQITRVIGVGKVAKRYKSFESRRQLLSEHDVFLADDRIITRLPKLLGKIFYGGSKRPVPVNLQPYKPKGEAASTIPKASGNKVVALPIQVAKEVETAISCAQVHLSPSTTTSIRVGSSTFTAQQIAENVDAVVEGMVKKYVSKGWRNIRSIHVKGPNTMALPLWLASELWQDEGDVLGDEEAKAALELANQKGRKRKGREDAAEPPEKKAKQTKRVEDTDLSAEMAERRAKLRQQKKEAKSEVDGDIERKKKPKKLDPDAGQVKVKRKKVEAILASA